MNHYCITFRFDTDGKFGKRYWENFADSRESAIQLLTEYVRDNFLDNLFPPKIFILRMDEYLSVFK